jgi:hypothetical protein
MGTLPDQFFRAALGSAVNSRFGDSSATVCAVILVHVKAGRIGTACCSLHVSPIVRTLRHPHLLCWSYP